MKRIFYLVAALVLLNSCQKEECEGFDTIIELEEVFLFISDDTLQYFDNQPNQFFGVSLSIFDDYKARDGKRNCTTDDLAIRVDGSLNPESLKISCDKELRSGSRIFAPNSELNEANITRITFAKNALGQIDVAKIDLIGLDNFTQDDDYRFKLLIESTDGKDFEASASVHIKL